MQIELKQLTVGIAGRVLLADLDATFTPGSMTALVGPSGSGKSTLLATIAGQVSPLSGTVHLDGILPVDIALMSQSPAILARRTVRDNVAVGALAAGNRYPAACSTADKLLEEMALTHLTKFRAFQISGGERQRVAILRVIAKGNSVILADEPTASLDPVSRLTVVDTLRTAADRGAIVLLATHDDFVAKQCDRAIAPWRNH